jgi:AcrR family transcriptional regulator
MQRLDDQKRAAITAAAVKLFATRPFHKVRLDDVAAAAKVGKGTVYLYFKNKDDLYLSIIYDSFAVVLKTLREELAGKEESAWESLRRIIAAMSKFAVNNPSVYELMRAVPLDRQRTDQRKELADLLEQTIRRGVRGGEMCDPHPELTATFLPSMIRAAMTFGPKELSEDVLTNQILRLLKQGLVRGSSK